MVNVNGYYMILYDIICLMMVNHNLVGGWALPLWKIMEWVRQLGLWHSIPNGFWKVNQNSMEISSHHQPVIYPMGDVATLW